MVDEDEENEDEEKEEEEEERDEESEEEAPAKKGKKPAGKRGRPSKKAEEKAEDEDEEEEEEEAKKTVKKQKQSAKKSAKTKEEKLDDEEEDDEEEEPKKKAKKPRKSKKPLVYKKGKFNPDVEELTMTPQLEDPSDEVVDYKSTKSNNRNIIRAAYTKNHNLLKKVFTSGKLSTFFDIWGAENDMSALELIFKNKDKKALEIFLDSYNGKDTRKAPRPKCYLREVNTGYNSIYTFGVKVRKVNMARGGREGNNAFVADLQEPSGFDDRFYEKIAVTDIDPHMVDVFQAKLGNPLKFFRLLYLTTS